jgi:hypothetical protein
MLQVVEGIIIHNGHFLPKAGCIFAGGLDDHKTFDTVAAETLVFHGDKMVKCFAGDDSLSGYR